ncbi:hypothetical protein [Mesorhizobium sp.]|uniref:hypothetical protein n=1 Tax=Mesorhizobium sp. TaxID=1871066 RepID=UPI0025B8C7D5|nr:hypothetical protein [Mesorhizobium sp.]
MERFVEDYQKRRLTERVDIMTAISILMSQGYEEHELIGEMTKVFYVDLDAYNEGTDPEARAAAQSVRRRSNARLRPRSLAAQALCRRRWAPCRSSTFATCVIGSLPTIAAQSRSPSSAGPANSVKGRGSAGRAVGARALGQALRGVAWGDPKLQVPDR